MAATPLTIEEETALCEAWRAGDKCAGDKLCRQFAAFTQSVALEYRRWGAPLDDLFQEASIGLLRAAEKFDGSKNTRFVTYASYWMRAAIREYVAANCRIVKPGSSKPERRLLRAVRRSTERNPDVLAAQTGLSPERVTKLLLAYTAPDAELSDTDECPGQTPEEALADAEGREYVGAAIRRCVRALPERQRAIIATRLLQDDAVPLTTIGVVMGVSKERVRQVEQQALRRLQTELSSNATVRDHAPFVARAAKKNTQTQFVW